MKNESLCYYDGFKCRIDDPEFAQSIIRQSTARFLRRIEDYRGFIQWESEKKFNGITINITTDWKTGDLFTTLAGSVHYISNDHKHNADQFTFSKLKTSLEKIQNDFNFDLEQAKLINIELGCNIFIHKDAALGNSIIRNVVFLNKKPKNAQQQRWEHPDDGTSFICRHDQHWKKLYCKSCEHEEFVEGTVIRSELKLTKSCLINRNGLFSMKDLLDPAKHANLLTKLPSYFRRLIIFQPELLTANLSTEELAFILKCNHYSTWANLTSLREFNRIRNKYLSIIDQHCSLNYTRAIIEGINERV